MKGLLFTLALLVSNNVFAARLINIQTLSNKTLEAARIQMNGQYTVVSHVSLNKIVELGKNEVVSAEMKEDAIAQALFYACPLFGAQLIIDKNSNDESGIRAATDRLNDKFVKKESTEYIAIENALANIGKEAGVEIYSGIANNKSVYGTFVSIYDSNTNEVAVFANTTCGCER